jgi:hypothetical protein
MLYKHPNGQVYLINWVHFWANKLKKKENIPNAVSVCFVSESRGKGKRPQIICEGVAVFNTKKNRYSKDRGRKKSMGIALLTRIDVFPKSVRFELWQQYLSRKKKGEVISNA